LLQRTIFSCNVATFVYTIKMDGFEWDETKRRENLDAHGVDFGVPL